MGAAGGEFQGVRSGCAPWKTKSRYRKDSLPTPDARGHQRIYRAPAREITTRRSCSWLGRLLRLCCVLLLHKLESTDVVATALRAHGRGVIVIGHRAGHRG